MLVLFHRNEKKSRDLLSKCAVKLLQLKNISDVYCVDQFVLAAHSLVRRYFGFTLWRKSQGRKAYYWCMVSKYQLKWLLKIFDICFTPLTIRTTWKAIMAPEQLLNSIALMICELNRSWLIDCSLIWRSHHGPLGQKWSVKKEHKCEFITSWKEN